MIILKLDDCSCEKRMKIRRRNKSGEALFDYTRAGVIVNNRPHFVISIKESTLCDEKFKKLLERYKGEIITGEKLSKNEFISNLLFDEKPYLKKALFQNFIRLFDSEKSKYLNVFVVDSKFDLKDEIPLLLPKIKSLTVKVNDEFLIRDWQRNCFLEYGVKPVVLSEKNSHFLDYDVFVDFDKLHNKSLCVDFLNEQKIIYPDIRFLAIPPELKFLEDFELESSTICAVFGSLKKQ